MYATDRQIIERLLIPAMMQVVLVGIRNSLGEDAALLDPVTDLLGEALREPVANHVSQAVFAALGSGDHRNRNSD